MSVVVPPYRIYVGFSPDEVIATNTAMASLRSTSLKSLDLRQMCRLSLWGSYTRPTSRMPSGQLWDGISDAPMSTDHAIARFFIPWLCDYKGWALFVDGDVLLRRNVADLFDLADPKYAVMCVHHPILLAEGEKKSGALQISYPRKNWSSVMLFNCGHPSNKALTLDVLNAWPGRDLHAFRWLQDAEIGALPPEWNYLAGVNPPMADPALVHYTLGYPAVEGHAHDPFADEWFFMAKVAGYKLTRPPLPLEHAG